MPRRREEKPVGRVRVQCRIIIVNENISWTYVQDFWASACCAKEERNQSGGICCKRFHQPVSVVENISSTCPRICGGGRYAKDEEKSRSGGASAMSYHHQVNTIPSIYAFIRRMAEPRISSAWSKDSNQSKTPALYVGDLIMLNQTFLFCLCVCRSCLLL